MINNRSIYFFISIFLMFLWGCTDEIILSDSNLNPTDEIEVAFDLAWPDSGTTKAYLDEYGNERFSNGDMIHILGTFQTESLMEDGTTTQGTTTRYGAMEYNGKNWVKKEGSNLTWPAISTSGSFVAYYISGSNGLLTGKEPTETFSLSNLSSTTDPLKAISINDIPYGNAVKLEFSHICAFLTIEDLEPHVSDIYWFIRQGDLKDQNGDNTVFNNAFQIGLGTGEHGPTLEFKFLQVPSTSYENLVYISANRIVNEPTEENHTESTSVEYFLEPGYYNTFQLVYPSSTSKYFSYIEYTYNPDKTAGESASIAPLLEANTRYTLNIRKSKGNVTVNNPFTEGGWDEKDDATVIVDVKSFLEAATQGKSYSENDIPILQSDGNGTTTLVRNVDFDFYDYARLEGNYPNMPENVTFDGGLHYIQNLNDPLFRYNRGTIRNLGIRNVIAPIISEEISSDDLDNSRNGALCHYNTGIIDNIRIRNVNLNVGIKSHIITGPGNDGSETHNIGGLVGSNTGSISEIAFGGSITINVSAYSDPSFDNEVNASVLIGGVVGQNAANGKITDISILDEDLSVKITNSCIGTLGSYSVGGIVGQSSGYIIAANLSNVTIDGSKSIGVTSYMGGMAGQLTLSNNDGSMENCIVSGKVIAGISKKYGSLDSRSYTGGIAGAVYNMPVKGCRSMLDVAGPTEEMKRDDVLYATGGGFGRIRSANNYNFSKLIIWGSNLTGLASFIGNFAGIAPDSENWTDWMENFGTYEINVRQFGTYKNIGENIADQDSQTGND